jgi:hypothetical protein
MRHALHGIVLIAALVSLSARAQTITLVTPGHKIGIAVGASGAGVSTVSFTLGSQAIGTPIPQSGAAIPIEIAYFRRTGGGSYNATITLTASPAAAYPNGLTSGANIVPWSEISWTVANQTSSGSTTVVTAPSAGSFPAAFPTPTLMSLQCARNAFCYVQANYTFSYKNTNVVAAGTYTGVMTYTVTAQ